MDPDRPEAFLSEIGQATALYRYNGHWFYGCIDKWKRLWLTSGILQFAPVSYRTRVQRQIIGGPFRSGADSSFCDNSREAVLAYDSYGDPVFSGFDRKVMASIEMDALHGNFMNTQFLCCQRYQVCCRFSLRFQMYFSSCPASSSASSSNLRTCCSFSSSCLSYGRVRYKHPPH